MWAFVATVFEVTAILLRLAFEVTTATVSVIAVTVATVSTTTVVIATTVATATFAAFTTKATTWWFEWQWFFTGNFHFWHCLWVLNGQAQDVKCQFFRSEFLSQFNRITFELVKVRTDSFIRKVAFDLLKGNFLLSLEGFLSCWWLKTFHAFLSQVFDDSQVTHFVWSYESNRLTWLACTSCTSNTVNVAFWILWNIIVVDVSDTWNVKTTCRNVCGNQDIDLVVLEVTDNTKTFVLVKVTVDTFCTETTKFQTTCQLIHTTFGTTKDNWQFWLVNVHKASHGIKLLLFLHSDKVLVNVNIGQFFSLDFHMLRIFHELNANTFDSIRHSCWEEKGLTFFWYSANDSFNVFKEAHVKHFIRFIQNQSLNVIEFKSLTFDKVKETTWCPYNNVGTWTEGLDLFFNARTTVDWANFNAFVTTKTEKLFLRLHCQLTCWGNHKGLDCIFFCTNFI